MFFLQFSLGKKKIKLPPPQKNPKPNEQTKKDQSELNPFIRVCFLPASFPWVQQQRGGDLPSSLEIQPPPLIFPLI